MEPFRNGTGIEQQWSRGLSIDSGCSLRSAHSIDKFHHSDQIDRHLAELS
jgi:hypothetical protein